MSHQNFVLISSFFFVFFFISHICKFSRKMPTSTPIKLKLGIHKGLIKVHPCGWNLIKIYGVMTNFLHKNRLKVCHIYKVNRWKELVETRHVNGVTIIGVSFVIQKESEKDHRDMTQNKLVSKLRERI